MINTQRPVNRGERNGRLDDLDGLLRRFFRSEMPKNWPAPPRVTESPRPLPRPWYRQPGRLALAAAISFFLLGYLALANWFPAGADRGIPIKPLIGQRDRLPKIDLPSEIKLMPDGRRIESSGYRQGSRIILDVKETSK
jgi:hypothetical protein